MTELTLLLLIVTGSIAMLDWRRGFAMCVVIGVAQDPLRKLAAGQPVYYVVLVAVVLCLTLLRAHLSRVNLSPTALGRVRPDLSLSFKLFLALVAAQAMHSFVAYGSYLMTGIGLLVWLTPIPAVVLAYQFAMRRGLGALREWMAIYCVIAMLALAGVYLEYSGLEWKTLGEVGEGLAIYDLGTTLKAHSGFFRSSEIAAWHTAAVSCFIFALAIGKRATLVRVAFALGLVAVLVSLGILTGRRKMLMELVIFFGMYVFLYAWLQKGAGRLAMSALFACVAGYVAIVGFVQPDLVQHSYTKSMQFENVEGIEHYAIRGKSVFSDVPNRVSTLGLQPVVWALEGHGWLGAGLGSGSQGTQSVAERYGIHWGAAEGGLGKVTLELGLPGVPLLLWLIVSLTRHLRERLLITAHLSRQHTRLSMAMIAFLVANVATFSIATQAYSDPFILILMGWTLGFIFALPELAVRATSRAVPVNTRAVAPHPARPSMPGISSNAAP